MPIGLPATKMDVRDGTFLLQTETELVLKSRRVIQTSFNNQASLFISDLGRGGG